jgi:hypothetical protein
VRALKEKFAQEMRLADESNDRIRSIHSNTHLEQLQLLRQSEQEAVAALLGKQQQEVERTLQLHSRDLEKCRAEQERFFAEWQESLQSQVAAQQSSREEEIKERVKREGVMELENIKQKLREEASQERLVLKRSSEESLREERLKSEAHLEALHRSSAKTEEDCVTLRREVESLRLRVHGRRSELAETKGELDEELQRYRVAGIGSSSRQGGRHDQQRGQGQESNEVLFEYETTLEGGLLAKRESLESWIRELREAVEREKERKEKEESELHLRVRERKTAMTVSSPSPLSSLLTPPPPQDEVSRIEAKIASLLRSRDSHLGELRRALAEAQERNRDLEEQLDEDRGKSIASGTKAAA